MRNCDISSYQILQYYVGEGSQSQIFIFVFGEIDLRVAENQEYRGGTPTEFAIGESPIAETRRYFGWTWGIVRGFRDAAFFWGVLAPNYYWPMGRSRYQPIYAHTATTKRCMRFTARQLTNST